MLYFPLTPLQGASTNPSHLVGHIQVDWEREGIIAYERKFHPSNIKTWTPTSL